MYEIHGINAVALEDSLRFHRGKALITPREFKKLLDQLGIAQEKGRENEVFRLETKIRAIASGVYEGYLGDDLAISRVLVLEIRRKGNGANAHTYHIELGVLRGTVVRGTTELELMQFLSTVNREQPSGSQVVRPRFHPV